MPNWPSRRCGSRTKRRATEDTLGAAVERHLSRYFADFDDGLPPPGLYHRILREVE